MFGDSHPFQDSDSSLLATLTQGDEREAESALERLHQRYHAELWRFAYTIVTTGDIAEDIVQDAFVTLWNKRTTFDVTQSVRAYLYAIVRNGALMSLRSDRIQARALESIRNHPAQYTTSPVESSVHSSEIQDRVTQAISILTERQRTAVTLRWLRGMPYDEVATIMGISRQAVDALLQRTYVILRDVLAPLK